MLGRPQPLGDLSHLIRARDLRQDHRVQPRPDHYREILGQVTATRPVHPDQMGHAGIGSSGQCLHRVLPRSFAT